MGKQKAQAEDGGEHKTQRKQKLWKAEDQDRNHQEKVNMIQDVSMKKHIVDDHRATGCLIMHIHKGTELKLRRHFLPLECLILQPEHSFNIHF